MPTAALTPESLLTHWQGHRRLTRRVIAAFPADKLFSLSIGGMRSFGEIAQEVLGMAVPTVAGVVTGEWKSFEIAAGATTQEKILEAWDEATSQIEDFWPQIAAEAWPTVITAFGAYTMPVRDLILYVIDNEIHHRGQGYVYLRSLGIEPPHFYGRE